MNLFFKKVTCYESGKHLIIRRHVLLGLIQNCLQQHGRIDPQYPLPIRGASLLGQWPLALPAASQNGEAGLGEKGNKWNSKLVVESNLAGSGVKNQVLRDHTGRKASQLSYLKKRSAKKA